MAGRIVVFGATGYTGRLVAERLAGAGERPVLAGRPPGKLSAPAAAPRGPQTAPADVVRPHSGVAPVGGGGRLGSPLGPFTKWGEPAVRAAITGKAAAYIDSTGEPAFIRRVFQNHGPVAKSAGVPLLTAMGYDFVPGALAGALALEEARKAAVRVDVGYYALGMTTQSGSTGTRASLVGASLDEGHAFRDGALRTVRTAERVRSFPVRDKERPAVSVGGAEHLGLPAAYPRLREVNVYLGWFGPFARPMQAGALVGSGAARLPGGREALTFAGERPAAPAGGPQAGTPPRGGAWVAAPAVGGAGRQRGGG